MNTCFLITSFCNSEKKVSCLENCIDNLKKISKNDICIHAHFSLPSSIQKRVNHFMYDYSNPILKFPEKYLNFWRKHLDSNLTMSIAKNDFGFTVLQQWKRGYDYLKQLGYDSIIIINYDVIITDNLQDHKLWFI